jgi:hypothetical protein
MKTYTDFLTESSLSRLWKKYKECDSGTISAFRGYRTHKENMAKHHELVGKLLGAGLSVTKIQGTFIENYDTPYAKEVHELSLIVFDYKNHGKLKDVLMKLGAEFEQESITYCNAETGDYYLIGCLDTVKITDENGNVAIRKAYPQKGVEIRLGKSMFGEGGKFFSKINGRPFVFKESHENEIDMKATHKEYQINTLWVFDKMARESLTEDEIA